MQDTSEEITNLNKMRTALAIPILFVCITTGICFLSYSFFPNMSIAPLQSTITQSTAGEGLAQDPYVAARVGCEPATLRTQGTNRCKEPILIYDC